MAAVFFVRIPGDPDDLLDRLERHAPVWERLASHWGLISLTVIRTPNGVTEIQTWESADSFGPHLEDPVVADSLRALGFADVEVQVEGPFPCEREFRR